jgi:hypothetical protein
LGVEASHVARASKPLLRTREDEARIMRACDALWVSPPCTRNGGKARRQEAFFFPPGMEEKISKK